MNIDYEFEHRTSKSFKPSREDTDILIYLISIVIKVGNLDLFDKYVLDAKELSKHILPKSLLRS